MTDLQEKLRVLHTDDGLVDLFTLNATSIGGSLYHFSPHCYSNGTLLSWGGISFTLIPIGIDGFQEKSTATDLPQPTLTVSNVGGVLLAPVVALGDLVGATMTYHKVYASNLDDGDNPDASKFVDVGSWTITQKMSQTNQSIQWQLSCPLDLPGMMFPVRQILIYPGVTPPDGIYFPGVSPYRMDQYQSA
jgi:lambda family phage minor tail protein L